MNTANRTREPLYPLAYAAALAGLDARTARRWIRGYTYKHGGEVRRSPPVVPEWANLDAANDRLSFQELLTLRLVRAFQKHGLGLPTIKRAAKAAQERFGVGQPFVTKAFRTDGREVFLALEKAPEVKGEERMLVHALTGQQQFVDVVEPSLFKDVVFVGDVPGEWFPLGKEHAVVLRPDRAFGAPHIDGTGVRTDVVADAMAAEGGDEAAQQAVAEWFGLTAAQVADAVAAEAQWQTRTAA